MESRFIDNVKYSAEDVDKAFAGLTAQGVSLFLDTNHTLTDLNTAAANLMTPGVEAVTPDACKVVKEPEGYFISAGTAYMPGGATVTVDEARYKIEPQQGAASYVYFEKAGHEIRPVVSVNEPSENCLLLATIDANGELMDKRTLAATKFCTIGNTYYKETFTYYNNPNEYNYVTTIQCGGDYFKYLIMPCFFIQLEEGEKQFTYANNPPYNTKIIKTGSTIEIFYKWGNSDQDCSKEEITIYLF